MDEIEVEVSHIGGLNFLEGLEEIVANQTGYVNIYAVDALNHRYSNCSFIPVNVDINNPSLVKRIHEDLPYEEYLNYIDKIYSGNENYRELMRNHANDQLFNIQAYRKYIEANEITEDELRRLFRLYRNYGLCKRIVFKGDFKGDTAINVKFHFE